MLLSITILPTSEVSAESPQVKVTGGMIQGYIDEYGVKTFKGIPFADTTAGKNRWKAPQPVKSWQGVKDCTKFGQIAVQAEPQPFDPWTVEYVDSGMNLDNGLMGEDCLSLNIWTKANENEKLPVIVYIHGGANLSGSSQNDVYSGQEIAQKNIVYVSINYRVGIFGFLAYKDEIGEEVTGNFAIMDQIAALKWIKKNISKFGGDPNNVTIIGQSAGSNNVQNLIASTAAAGLFDKAIALSFNNYTASEMLLTRDLQDVESEAKEKIGKYTIKELREMSPSDILALGYTPTSVVKGTSTGTLSLKDAFDSGKWNKVDMIWGGVAGDQYLFDSVIEVGNFIKPADKLTLDDYMTSVNKSFGSNADRLLKLYPGESKDNALNTARQVNIDKMIANYFYAASQKYKSDKNYKTYLFCYEHIIPDTPERMVKFGAFHTSDVNYWLNHFTKIYPRNFTSTDYALGDAMSSYIVNFAKTGNPNGKDNIGRILPTWKEFSPNSNIAYLHIGDDIQYFEMDSAKSNFWKSILK